MYTIDELVGKAMGEYRIVQLLGRSAINAVYAAQQQETGQSVLLTLFLIPSTFSAPAHALFERRFIQKAAVLKQLTHPHIVPLNDFGTQWGYPYLVSPFVTTSSLARMLTEQTRLTPAQTLAILKPLAQALDYAHSHGVVHGSLRPTNVLLGSGQAVQIAGFGLSHITMLQDIQHSEIPYAHLLNIGGTFLSAPEYMAPEFIQGAPMDARTDLYALGILLFELLHGQPPFIDRDPFKVAKMHIQQPLPLLQTLHSDLPAALDMILQSALQRDPAQRISSAGKLALSFERMLHIIHSADATPSTDQTMEQRDITLPPTINWFDEKDLSQSGSYATPIHPGSEDESGLFGSISTLEDTTEIATNPALIAASFRQASEAQDAGSVDPFVWWTGLPKDPISQAGIVVQKQASSGQSPNKERRKMLALAATGGVVAILGASSFSLAHMLSLHQQASGAVSTTLSPTMGVPTQTVAPTATMKPTVKPTVKPTTSTAKTTPAATVPTTPPTAVPAPPPTAIPTAPPSHTGTVIGNTNQPTNSATMFNGAFLIHLPNGSFVAYNNSCTHEGAGLRYDSGSQHLLCTRHSAAFDPANNANPLYGPPPGPLARVTIRVNSDGTITV